jgi:hypothetical protein
MAGGASPSPRMSLGCRKAVAQVETYATQGF